MIGSFQDLLNDLSKDTPASTAALQAFRESEVWQNLPEAAKAVFAVTPDDLQTYANSPIALGDNMPERLLVEQVGALMSRNGLRRTLGAIAINCMNEGGNKSDVSERFASYVIPLRLTIDYIIGSLRHLT